MSYYRGDYYRPRGDYYRSRGDWLGGITGAIGGFLTGGWGGALIGGVKGATTKKSTASQVAGGLVAQGGGIMGPVVVNPGAILPGGKPFIESLGGHNARKYKRIDPTNVKALRRAIRRQGAFMAVVKRTIRGTGMTLKRTGIGGTRKKKR